jgi:prophage maintenance system killer protein/virulence-associated protein VapD
MFKNKTFIFSRYFTTHLEKRKHLLNVIYKPFFGLKKDSAEYLELAKSGKIWESHFKPWNIDRELKFQTENSDLLSEIDSYKQIKIDMESVLSSLTAGLAQQSVYFEGNSLKLGDSILILESLKRFPFFKSIINSTYSFDISSSVKTLPTAEELLPNRPIKDVLELRNQLIVSELVSKDAMKHISLDEGKLKYYHSLLLKDTEKERVEGWGRIQLSGVYRSLPIQAHNSPKTVYPYPLEVPSLMKFFFQNKNDYILQNTLHPVLLATHLMVTFLHIHPFHDGNGRLGRLIFGFYLIKNGYPPLLFHLLGREEYIRMIFDAQHKNIEDLYLTVLETMKNKLIEISY